MTADVTLRQWADQWSRERMESGIYRDAPRSRRSLMTFLGRAPFAELPITEITTEDVRRFVSAELGRKARRGLPSGDSEALGRVVRWATVDKDLIGLRLCLRDAHEAGMIARNPAATIRIPREPRTEEPWTYLELDEIACVTSDPMPRELALLAQIAIYTGIRKGELFGLRRADVRFGARPHLVVRHSYDGPTKSGRPRIVPLLPPAIDALRELEDLVGDRPNPLGLVAHDARGAMRRPHSLIQQWHRWRPRAGVERRVRWHDLRHTFASHLVMGSWGRTWRLEEIAAVLGHSDLSTTMRYAHLSPDTLHAAVAETALFFEVK